MSDDHLDPVPENYDPPQIHVRGSVNDLTKGGSVSGTLDASYPVGTSSSYGGGLFS
jgi:hypothetical protein